MTPRRMWRSSSVRWARSVRGSVSPPARLDPMTTASPHTRSPLWVLAFLAAVLAVLIAAFGAAPASATATVTAQNGVGASYLAGPASVEPSARVVAGQRLGNDPPQAQIVVASGVAAEAEAPLIRLTTEESWANPNSLADHFSRHGGDFGAASADEPRSTGGSRFKRSGGSAP